MKITVKKGNALIEVDDHTVGKSMQTFPETTKQLISDIVDKLKKLIDEEK